MPYKATEARRRMIPKARYRVENRAAYDAALHRCGDLAIWVSPEAIAAWTPPTSRTWPSIRTAAWSSPRT